MNWLKVLYQGTITISEDVYEELLKIKESRDFSEALKGMMKRERNLNTLQIGLGSRDSKEKEMLKPNSEKLKRSFRDGFDSGCRIYIKV